MKDAKKNALLMAGAAFATTMAMSMTAQASENPFQVNALSAGYQVADNAEGKCGEGKCGEAKKDHEGKCGEGKCGEAKKDGEGKCGEGKCGESKKDGEGKCGEGKCGES